MEEIIQDVIEMATTTLEQEESREESREEDVTPPPAPSTEIAPLPPNLPMLDEEEVVEEAEEKNTNDEVSEETDFMLLVEEETFEDDEDFMSARPAVPEEEESEESGATSLQETSSIQESSSPVGLEKTTTEMSADMENSEAQEETKEEAKEEAKEEVQEEVQEETKEEAKEKAKEETDFGEEIRTLDPCGFSEEMIRLAAEGKSRNNGGLNKFDVGVVLEKNQESSDGTRKQLNKRLLQLLNDVPFDLELEIDSLSASDVASEMSSSSVPDLVVDFETKREQRSRGQSVEDLFESRFDEDVAQPNPTPTVQ